ncbi:ATP-dependent DNA helicase RecG [Palleniella muris]|uniref:ATP-dependent DNA helicase RecG n=1 Tax=Palleniella muris TaxID=3038145 RepID=A0AC61QPG4_9BACT|nr:ATP-binding protein [Palleniella muris]TGX81604.1 ATP-dependent DNA helicase RecG [Palleniella muris]
MVINIPSGSNKPYKTKKGGLIYVKQGADKRQINDNREILRMFYESGQYYPDKMGVPNTSVKNLSESLIDKFFLKQFGKTKEDFDVPIAALYENLCLLDEKGQATLAGLLFFGIMPTWKCPQFKIKAVCFVGNDKSGTEYRDSVDIEGTIPEMYEQAIRFCEGNLRHLQEGQSFNSTGRLEVSRIALEELIQNALVHRETLGDDVVKLFIFDNRIEIESPGCLPADLTIERIMLGNATKRNPQLSQFCGKTMPYRGLGTGITRAIKSGSRVELNNDIERDKFVAIIWRDKNNAQLSPDNAQLSPDNVKRILESTCKLLEGYNTLSDGKIQTLQDMTLLIASRPAITSKELVEWTKASCRTVTEYTNILQQMELIKREGSKKTGGWVLCDKLKEKLV